MRSIAACLIAAVLPCVSPLPGAAAPNVAVHRVTIGYKSPRALSAALARHPAVVLRRLPALGVAEVETDAPDFVRALRALPGIRFVGPLRPRRSELEPALFLAPSAGTPYEWQFQATHANTVPASVLRGASAVTIAIVDSGVGPGCARHRGETASCTRRPHRSLGRPRLHLSLVAPGQNVFGAVAAAAPFDAYPRVSLPRSARGLYGCASGTSFAAPQVSGAAALVMAANPFLRATEVGQILKESASGHGSWTPTRGYGVLDVAAAVARAQGKPSVSLAGVRERGRVLLSWFAQGAASFRLSMSVDGRGSRLLLDSTSLTSATHALRPGTRYVFTLTALDTRAASAFSIRG